MTNFEGERGFFYLLKEDYLKDEMRYFTGTLILFSFLI